LRPSFATKYRTGFRDLNVLSLREDHAFALPPESRDPEEHLNATRPYGIDVEEVMKRASQDVIQHRRAAYRERPDPHFLTFGPKNRREFLANLRARGGSRV
jgi:hypothetical protein